jgi:hypothetical protein
LNQFFHFSQYKENFYENKFLTITTQTVQHAVADVKNPGRVKASPGDGKMGIPIVMCQMLLAYKWFWIESMLVALEENL